MNKLVIVGLALGLTACESKPTAYAPKYKVGDCAVHVRNPDAEKWETVKYDVVRVLDVGRAKYHGVDLSDTCAYLVSRNQGQLCFESLEFRSFDYYYNVKAQNCPKIEDLPSYQK